jgi:hypothetical protein
MVLLLSILELEESIIKGRRGGYQLRALDRMNGFNAAVRLRRDPRNLGLSPSTLDTVVGGVDGQMHIAGFLLLWKVTKLS